LGFRIGLPAKCHRTGEHDQGIKDFERIFSNDIDANGARWPVIDQLISP